MGKANRSEMYPTSKVPGPGAYEQKSAREGPKYHFGGKGSQSVASLQPGPAEYAPDYKLRHRATVYRYSLPGRPVTAVRSVSPGPGTYELRSNKERTGGRFGKEQRGALYAGSGSIPGPGTYDRQAPVTGFHTSPKFS